jgi:RNA polymerase sigma factor (sigma-70 family)
MSNVDGPLKTYVTDRSDNAFRTLIERHGPMVAATCRRVLGDESEAQDAAQAVFLILARKAASVGDEQSLGPWLHRVAVRVACEMKRKKHVRGEHERKAASQRPQASHSPLSDEESARVKAALDEEIDALPEKLRLPVVLCLVDQKPVAQAAKDLGLTDGQVRGRLDRARERLRQALTVRGVGVSSAVMPLLLTEALSGEPLITAVVVKKLLAAGAYVANGASGLGAGVSQNRPGRRALSRPDQQVHPDIHHG